VSEEVAVAGRRCPGQGCPTIITNGARRCPRHAKAYEERRGSSTQRGLGAAHQRKRAAIQRRINDGEDIRCWMCDARLVGTAWHLDHTVDRTAYRGPACITCNTSDGGKRGAQATNSR
jgi:hypothetical protein